MGNDTIITREVTIAYYDGKKLLHCQQHIVWDIDRFTAALNVQAAKNRAKGEGFTEWQVRP